MLEATLESPARATQEPPEERAALVVAVTQKRWPAEIRILGGLKPFPSECFRVKVEENAPPFIRLEAVDADLAFHVLEPHELEPGYAPELSAADEESLELDDPEDARLLVLVNLNRGADKATVNMAAPIVINLRTGRAQQVVPLNAAKLPVRRKLL